MSQGGMESHGDHKGPVSCTTLWQFLCHDPGYVCHTRLYRHRVHVSPECETSTEASTSSGVWSWAPHPCSMGRAFSSCHPWHQLWAPLVWFTSYSEAHTQAKLRHLCSAARGQVCWRPSGPVLCHSPSLLALQPSSSLHEVFYTAVVSALWN